MIDGLRPQDEQRPAEGPSSYTIATIMIMVVIWVGVSALEPPIWLGMLMVGALMAVAVGILQLVKRWRART